MAAKTRRSLFRRRKRTARTGWLRRALRWVFLLVAGFSLGVLALIILFKWVAPPINHTQATEWWRLGDIKRSWISLEAMSPHLPRAAVAAEDANFCLHWGVDLSAVRLALEGGARRGGSTISQQTDRKSVV